MKNTIVYILGGLFAAKWLSSKKSNIGGVYPNIENEITAYSINGYIPSQKTIREANFILAGRNIEKEKISVTAITSSTEAIDNAWKIINKYKVSDQKIIVLFLNKGNVPVSYTISNTNSIKIDEVIKDALRTLSSSIILVEHVSRPPNKSELTTPIRLILKNQIKEKAELFRIKLLDYVILSKDFDFSMANEDIL